MNLSGIVVSTLPKNFHITLEALNKINSIEVYHCDESTGQIVVVQEADTVRDEIEGLKFIKKLPMISYAEMVYHYLAEDNSHIEITEDDLKATNLDETLSKLNT